MEQEIVILNKFKHHFSNNLIIDIGGFQGDWSQLVMDTGFNGKIMIFEPNSENYNFIKKRCENNSNIEVLCLGVGDECYNKKYYDLQTDNQIARQMSGFVKRPIYDGYEYIESTLQIVSLDSFKLDQQIDFVKIDVEGYEYNVLIGMSDLLKSGKVEFIQFEYGGTYLDAKYKLNDILQFLSRFGYKVYDIDLTGEATLVDNYTDDYQYNNFLATRHTI